MPLATKYLGLSLKNPLVASASPANTQIDHLRRLEDAGAAAGVLRLLISGSSRPRTRSTRSSSTKPRIILRSQ